MGKIHWGKFQDAPLATSVSGAPFQGPAHRQLVCSFSGRNYVVEREDNMLNVYLVSATPLPLNMTGDAAPDCGCDGGPHQRVDAKRLQDRIVEWRKKQAGGR
jgi:hypothetical protein